MRYSTHHPQSLHMGGGSDCRERRPSPVVIWGVATLQAATRKCIGGFIATHDADGVNLHDVSKEINRFT